MFCWSASRYNRVKKNQLDAQHILSIFRQPIHVSGVSRLIIRTYNRMYTATGTYYSFWMTVCRPGWINPTRITESHLRKTVCTSCCIHTVVRPDDEPRYARNMYRLTKYTKNMLCIKLVFLYTNIQLHIITNVYWSSCKVPVILVRI